MIKKSVAGVVVLTLALVVGLWLALRHRTARAAERLVVRAIERDARPRARPSHAPVPGMLHRELAAALGVIVPEHAWTSKCNSVANGAAPLEELPAGCEVLWLRWRALAIAAMRASRAETWTRPAGVGPDSFMFAVHLAALEVRKAPPAEALEVCADAIALARDRAIGEGVLGAMIAANVVQQVARPCTEALAAATPEVRGRAHAALTLIAGSWPPASVWIADEMTALTNAFLPVLTDAQLERLPLVAKADAPMWNRGVGIMDRLWLADALPHTVPMFERIERAASLEPGARDAEIAAIEAEEEASWNPIRKAAGPGYSKFFARDDERQRQLKALLEAATPRGD